MLSVNNYIAEKTLNETIWSAANKMDWKTVKAAVQEGNQLDVNYAPLYEGKKRRSILWQIILNWQWDLVKDILLKCPNIDINAPFEEEGPHHGKTILWMIVWMQRWELVRSVLKLYPKADVNVTVPEGHDAGTTVLWWMAACKQWDLVWEALKGPYQITIDATVSMQNVDYGRTILWWLSCYQQWDLVKEILKRYPNVNINAKAEKGDYQGVSILWCMARYQQWDLVKDILKRYPNVDINAKVERFPYFIYGNERTSSYGNERTSVLCWMAHYQQWDLIENILERSSMLDVNAMAIGEGVNGKTVLWHAVHTKRWAMVEKILQRCPAVNVNAISQESGSEGKSILWMIAADRQWNILQKIIEHNQNADVNLAPYKGTEEGNSVLSLLITAEQWEFVKLILQKFRYIKLSRAPEYAFPVWLVKTLINNHQWQAMEYLLQYNANLPVNVLQFCDSIEEKRLCAFLRALDKNPVFRHWDTLYLDAGQYPLSDSTINLIKELLVKHPMCLSVSWSNHGIDQKDKAEINKIFDNNRRLPRNFFYAKAFTFLKEINVKNLSSKKHPPFINQNISYDNLDDVDSCIYQEALENAQLAAEHGHSKAKALVLEIKQHLFKLYCQNQPVDAWEFTKDHLLRDWDDASLAIQYQEHATLYALLGHAFFVADNPQIRERMMYACLFLSAACALGEGMVLLSQGELELLINHSKRLLIYAINIALNHSKGLLPNIEALKQEPGYLSFLEKLAKMHQEILTPVISSQQKAGSSATSAFMVLPHFLYPTNVTPLLQQYGIFSTTAADQKVFEQRDVKDIRLHSRHSISKPFTSLRQQALTRLVNNNADANRQSFPNELSPRRK